MAESKASKTDALVKAVLVFFISLLSFSIGTFVGKKFSDNQYKIAKLSGSTQEEGSARDVASVHPSEGETKTETANDEQVAKAAEEFVNDDEGSKAHDIAMKHETNASHDEANQSSNAHGTSSTHGITASHGEAKTDSAGHIEAANAHHEEDAGEAPAKRDVATVEHANTTAHGKMDKEISHATANIAADKNPPTADKTKAHAGPSTTLPSQVAKSPNGKLTVQVASFPTEDEAKKKVTEIRALGFDSFFTSVNLSGKNWYRVNVGMFPTVAEGEKIIAELKEKQIKSGFIQKMAQ